MASFSRAPWDAGQVSGSQDANAYCACCLIDANPPGEPRTKDNCKLPVKSTPGGAVNLNALHAAAVVLAGGRGGVSASSADKKSAARKLIRLYQQAGEVPPASLRRAAGG